MAKNIPPTNHYGTEGDDRTRALLGVPGAVPYDLLRVWIADRYQVEPFEIAHELGLDPEPTWFSNEGDIDFDAEQERENRDRWRAWKKSYNEALQSDPERYRRILAKVCLQYADEFLRMAGVSKPPEPVEATKTICPCGEVAGASRCIYKGRAYCSPSCSELPMV